MLSRTRTGIIVGIWAAALLCLYDMAALGPAALPWSSPWGFILEVAQIGLIFYALPFALLLGKAGAVLGALRGGEGRGASFPVSLVAAGSAAALLATAFGALEGGGRMRWMTAPWVLIMVALAAGCLLAGWTAGRAAGAAAASRHPKAALTALAIAPALPALAPLASLLLAAGLPGGDRHAPRARNLPDIVMVVADTLRADRLAGERGSAIMPELRALAARGVMFSDATAHASWTNPSTATILSGLLPTDHGMRGYGGRIRPGIETLATILDGHGYDTAAIVANPLVSRAYGFDRGFRHWDEEQESGLLARHRRTLAARIRHAVAGGHDPGRTMRAPELVDRALSILRGRGERPLFLYLHFMDPHDPYGPPPPPLAEPADPAYEGDLHFDPQTLYGILRGEIEFKERDLAHARALYDAEISWMDGEIGRILRELGAAFDAGRVLTVFTADHGEEFMEHGSLGHEHTLYQELVHVPLVIARPGRLPEGIVVDEPVSHLDLVPSVLDAAGLPPLRSLPGRSLIAPPGGEMAVAVSAAAPILSEEDFTGYRAVSHRMRSIRSGSMKLVLYSPNVFDIGPWRREIFDLAADPGESDPLASLPAGEESLDEALAEWKARSTDAGHRGSIIDPATQERLRALGYIE